MINDQRNCPSYWKIVDLYLYNSQLYFLATLSFKYSDFFSKILEIVSTCLIYAIFYLEFLLNRNSEMLSLQRIIFRRWCNLVCLLLMHILLIFTSYYSLACNKNMHFVKFRLKHSCNNLLFNMLDLTLTKQGRSTSQIPDSITV